MITFPYGEADFYTLITEGMYYVDRTDRIPIIENMGRRLLFLRPRRFGKTLLLSMLENYYDVRKADDFDRLFGHLAIGKNPTPLHNQYFILRWNFSFVSTLGDIHAIQTALYKRLNGAVQEFSQNYAHILPHAIPIDPDDAITSFEHLLHTIAAFPYKLYLLIDEYDNFANAVMMSMDPTSTRRYEDLVQGEGLLKTVFNVVKGALEGRGLDRVFITGVSPVVMNDLTSGFNVARNITFYPEFYDLCGFREAELTTILQNLAQTNAVPHDAIPQYLDTMRTFYNGYRFLPDQDALLYNPTLALYFLGHLQLRRQAPTKLLDTNLSMDKEKIAYIASLPEGRNVVTSLANAENPVTIMEMEESFGVKDMLYGAKTQQFAATLLLYLGVVTLAGHYTEWGELVLTIPNQVTRQLYYDELRNQLLPNDTQRQHANTVAGQFYKTGAIDPVCDFIEQHALRLLDNRDYTKTTELTIKAIFMTMIHSIHYYQTELERKLIREYCDALMLVRPSMRQFHVLDFLLEFKIVKLTEHQMRGKDIRALSRAEVATLPSVQAALVTAEEEIRHYRTIVHEEYYDWDLRLHCYAVVAVGYDKLVWKKIE